MSDVRELVLKRLVMDLVGPMTEDEIIEDRPSDRYLTGILFPPKTSFGAEQDDDAEAAGDGEESGGGPEAVASFNAIRPSTAGLSFAIRPENDSLPAITVRVTCGQYFGLADDEEKEGKDEGGQEGRRRTPTRWQRTPRAVEVVDEILEVDGTKEIDLSRYGISGMTLHLKTSPWNGDILVTAVVTNANELPEKPNRKNIEEGAFFQVSVEVEPTCGSSLLARPLGGIARDEDGKAAALIYRDASEYAVGHTCSAEWDAEAGKVSTSWIPVALVPATSADGDEVFAPLKADPANSPFNASWLAEAPDAELLHGLGALVDAYGKWISGEAKKVPGLRPDLKEQAEKHLATCEEGRTRMARGIELLAADADVRLAFRLANRAMLLQRDWSEGKPLVWRPFQLAFCLLALASTADPESGDRGTMDLLWFPTGGGKTEAYLLLTAFAIFVRRLRGNAPGWGGGVTVFMRYTLRLLTVQQYQRAAALGSGPIKSLSLASAL